MQKLTAYPVKEPRFTIPRITIAILILTIGLGGFLAIYNAIQHGGSMTQFDHPVHDWLVANRLPVLNNIMLTVTNIMSPVGFTISILVICSLWAWRKKEYWRPLLLVGAMGLAFVSAALIKHAVARFRPPTTDMIAPFELDSSFPSGHTIGIAVSLLVLGYLIWSRRQTFETFLKWTLTAVLGISLVAFSRLYLGYHWVSDVSASVCLALIILALVIIIDPLKPARAAASDTDL